MLQAPRGHASRVIIRPKVIVPDQIERTLAPVSACAPFCLRLGNFLTFTAEKYRSRYSVP